MATAAAPLLQARQVSALEPLVRIEEASLLLKRSHWALRQDVRNGKIRCVRLGRRILFEADELRRVIQDGRQ